MREQLPLGCRFTSNHQPTLPAQTIPGNVACILDKIGIPYNEGDEIVLPREITEKLEK